MMKTSLLILCAYFAIAASASTFTWVPQVGQSFTMIKCGDEVNLKFVVIDVPRGVLIEDNSSCTIELGQSGGVNADRKNDRSPVSIYAKALTCNWFVLMVPESHNDISETIVECVGAEYHD